MRVERSLLDRIPVNSRSGSWLFLSGFCCSVSYIHPLLFPQAYKLWITLQLILFTPNCDLSLFKSRVCKGFLRHSSSHSSLLQCLLTMEFTRHIVYHFVWFKKNGAMTRPERYFHTSAVLWWRKEISLKIKSKILSAAVPSVLLYGRETWPKRTKYISQLEVSGHLCLGPIPKISRRDRTSN